LSKVLSDEWIDKAARDIGFVKRSSKISAKQFLRTVLFDHLQYDQPSLSQHAFEMFEGTGKQVTKQAFNKKFNGNAVLFIKKLFEKFLSLNINGGQVESGLRDKYTAVRILDSTEFKLPDCFAKEFPGYSASNALACAAIQFEYDILSKTVNCLSLGNARESDKTFAEGRMPNINPGELIIRDLGYYSINSYQQIEDQKAFYISRLKPQVTIYKKEGEDYIPLSWAAITRQLEKNKERSFDQVVFIGAEQKKEVRLMAWLLAETDQDKRLKKKKGKKGKVSANDRVWSKLNVFITNIGYEDITVEEAYSVYRIRWQIELMFKIWKSILKIHLVRKMKPERMKCYLYSKFIWILLCWDITTALEAVIWKQSKELISPYKCYAILKKQSARVKIILFNARKKLKEWLEEMLKIFTGYGLKENKKGRLKTKNIMQYK
jgi:hypothetical protein